MLQELDDIPDGIPVNPERTKPWGTGHAVLVTKDVVKEPFVVINADDFYGASSYQLLADYFNVIDNKAGENYSMVGYGLEYTLSEYGHVPRGVCEKDEADILITVVERTQIERITGKIITKVEDGNEMELTGKEVVSINNWGFSPSFFEYLETYFVEFMAIRGLPKGRY